jgi:hypothetical protein
MQEAWRGTDLGGSSSGLVPANKIKQPRNGLQQSDLEFGEVITKDFSDIECYPNLQIPQKYKGQLFLTNYKVIFKPLLEFGQNALQPNIAQFFSIQLGTIYSIEKSQN